MAEFCSDLWISGGPEGHILGLTQPGTAAESIIDVNDGLGVTKPGVFDWFLHGESLVPVARSYQGDAVVVLQLDLFVRIVDDDGG